MNWKPIIETLEKSMRHSDIAEAAGMASSGHVHNLKSGLQKTVSYEIGCRLMEMHRKALRSQARAAKKSADALAGRVAA